MVCIGLVGPGGVDEHDIVPLSALPVIAPLIRETLKETEEQYQTLPEAEDKPHVLDDALVDRVTRLYTVQAGDVRLFEEQLARWRNEDLTPPQAQEIDRLHKQRQELCEVGAKILSLAEKFKQGTIDSILRKNDVELGLEALLGRRKR